MGSKKTARVGYRVITGVFSTASSCSLVFIISISRGGEAPPLEIEIMKTRSHSACSGKTLGNIFFINGR